MRKLIIAMGCLLSMSTLAAEPFSMELSGIKMGQILPKKQVFNGFGCQGQNISPAINWKNPPNGTKSFALTMYDPDAPTGSGWWHWVVVNIPASLNYLPENFGQANQTLPEHLKTILQSRTDFGTQGYGGPCPPIGHGTHRYIFTLYALKTEKLEIKPDTPAAMVGYLIHSNQLGSTRFETKFERK